MLILDNVFGISKKTQPQPQTQQANKQKVEDTDFMKDFILINGEKQCVKNCNQTNNKTYLFQQKCWNQCPEGSRPSDEDQKKCKLICPFERPFEIIDLQICVTNCSIIERKNKYCVTNYEGNKSAQVQDETNKIEKRFIKYQMLLQRCGIDLMQ